MDDATQLDWLYSHERERADAIWLSQPVGAGVMRDFTFAEGMREARCMAAYLRSLESAGGVADRPVFEEHGVVDPRRPGDLDGGTRHGARLPDADAKEHSRHPRARRGAPRAHRQARWLRGHGAGPARRPARDDAAGPQRGDARRRAFVGADRREAQAHRGQPAPCAGRSGDHRLYEWLHRRRQGRDAQLPLDVRGRRARGAPRHHGARSDALLLAARARRGARLHGDAQLQDRLPDLLRGEPGHVPGGSSARTSDGVRQRAAAVAEAAVRRLLEDAARTARAAAQAAAHPRRHPQEGAGGPRPRRVAHLHHRLRAHAARARSLVRHARDRAARALRHDRELRDQPLRAAG